MTLLIPKHRDTFTLAIPQDNKYKKFKRHTFSNDEAGFKLCETLIDKSSHHIILEATGTYSMKFTYWFCERGYFLSVINPKSSKYFNLLQGHGNKTDDVDAIALSSRSIGSVLCSLPYLNLKVLQY